MKKIFNLLTVLLTSIIILSFAEPTIKMGGLALYTVRDDMSKDPVTTLKAIADAGYKFIEAADYQDGKFYGMKPTKFKKTLKELGLTPISAHQGAVTLDNADEMIQDVKNAGFQYFVIPVPPMGHFKYDPETHTISMSDSVEVITNILNVIGKKCTDAGIQLLYHNHAFEFEANSKGIIPLEYFLENTDSANVNFQMDLFWTVKADKDPIEYFNKYPGRFKIWHVKDMDEEGNFAPVGQGTIDFARILDQKKMSGMEYYLVEQDRTFDMAPLEAIKLSIEGLKKFGFE